MQINETHKIIGGKIEIGKGMTSGEKMIDVMRVKETHEQGGRHSQEMKRWKGKQKCKEVEGRMLRKKIQINNEKRGI